MRPLDIYRAVLRIHRFLPSEMRQIGDSYLKQEFRSARSLTDTTIISKFLASWIDYQKLLSQQISEKIEGHEFNPDLLSQEQRSQLNALEEEIKRSFK